MTSQGDYAVMAAAVVEQAFPPVTVNDIHRIVAALNLLNAIVKLPDGRELTSYHYIKGMVACLFIWLLYHPQEGVLIDWDEQEDITYINVDGIQYSFHYVPLLRYYVKHRNRVGLTRQLWDGQQRQLIAVQLFKEAVGGSLPQVREEESRKLLRLMRNYNTRKIVRRINGLEGVEVYIRESPPQPPVREKTVPSVQKRRRHRIKQLKQLRIFVERHLPHPNLPTTKYGAWKQQVLAWKDTKCQHLYNLTLALKFNGWWEEEFELSRKGDNHVCRVVCYTGKNYGHLVSALVHGRPLYYIRPERLMHPGWRYFIRRTNWAWCHMTYTHYLLMQGHYNYLTVDGQCHSLCITYGLARYLAKAFPQLRFINVLNFTRFRVHRRVYSYKDLQCVPLHSKSRQLKVWMVVDPLLLLGDLDVTSLPKKLITEYKEAEDYDQFFQIEHCKGKMGLVAYSRYHLLPTIYKDIFIYGHYAHVLNDEGKWAIYSLLEEAFLTDFLYDRIYYDPYLYIVVGCKGEEKNIIHDMFHPV